MNRLIKVLGLILFLSPLQPVFSAHPQLFFSGADIPALQARYSDPQYGDFYKDPYNEIKFDCYKVYPEGRLNSYDPKDNYRQYYEAILSHGALLLIDPNGAACDYQSDELFFAYFNKALKDSRWSDCFDENQISTSFVLTALAIGFDWHYSRFTSAERTDIINKLSARADYIVSHADSMLEIPSTSDLTGSSAYLHRFKVLRNKFVMTFSALGTVAYALKGDVSETKRQTWLNKVNQCLGVWAQYASTDGVSHEGYGYHEFQFDMLFPMLAARRYQTGVNEFENVDYLAEHPYYAMYSWVPGGDHSFGLYLPFGDSGTEPAAYPRQNAAYAAMAVAPVSGTRSRLSNWQQKREPVNGIPTNSYVREGPLHYFLADHLIYKRSPIDLGSPTFQYFDDFGVFVWRSGWDDMATYFAMTCGRQMGSHQHPEQGNFIVYKGGAPFIGHHGYTHKRRSENYNIMHIGGQRLWGANDTSFTDPLPESKWPSITQVTATHAYFNVLTNLRPVYRPSSLNTCTREYVGIGDCFFVRDAANSDNSTSHQNFLHAYSTTAPEESSWQNGSFPGLNLDSNPTANPWSGGSGAWQIKTRTSGPYTKAMQVKDLSRASWSSSIAADKFYYNGAERTRGYALTRSFSGSTAASLMAFYFQPSGAESVVKWPGNDGEGGLIYLGSALDGYCVWPTGASINGTQGLTLEGKMGGRLISRNLIWARDCTRLAFNGTNQFTSSAAASFVYDAGSKRLQLRTSGAVSITLSQPGQVGGVLRNGSPMNPSAWSWASGRLTLQAPASANSTGDEYTINATAVESSHWQGYE